ncbi:MAG TPA: DUF4173 domain-containing protein, partial [Gemmatimonadales bacterium]|nr:DUF4173 domain-containing protein [Gemmatimonadales bacterium]
MTDRTRQGLAILAAALALGVAADALSRNVPDRLNAALGLAAFVLVLVALMQAGFVRLPGKFAPLGAPLALLGVALIWRDSPILFGLNVLGIGTVAVLASPRLRAVGRRLAGLNDYVHGAVELAAGTAAGAPMVALNDVDWRTLQATGRMRHAGSAAVGVAAAIPVAAVFGSLLMSADPVFNRLMVDTLDLDLDALASHVVQVLFCAWIVAGLLRVLCRSDGIVMTAGHRGSLGLLEVGVVLAVVDLLFLAFVAVQFRYLFGGDEQVRAIAGMSYAEYARRGFFELVAVAALSLPLLLLADWSLDQRERRRARVFRGMALLMLVLLDVMLASALYRMRLYTVQFGLTEQRFYTTAFMGWLVLVFGWFAATVLRGQRERFGTGALLAGWLVLAGLNLVNPDGIIAGVNLDRAAAGRPFDVAYTEKLSADALPALYRGLPRLDAPDACTAARRISE